MGKTVVALTVLNNLQLSGDDTRPALILAPLRVAEFTWSDEAAKWEHLTDLSVQPLVGDPAQRQKGLAKPARAFTLNYEQLVWLVEKFKNEPWPFGTLVLDEATKLKGLRVSLQTSKKGTEFVKGQGSVRAKALSKIAFKPGGVSGVLELTGAPAPNGLKDLWGQVWFLDAGRRLGRTFTGFKSRWFETGYDEHTLIPRPYAHAQIMEACRDLCLSVEPPPMSMMVWS